MDADSMRVGHVGGCMKKLLGIAVAALLVGVGAYAGSPYLAASKVASVKVV